MGQLLGKDGQSLFEKLEKTSTALSRWASIGQAASVVACVFCLEYIYAHREIQVHTCNVQDPVSTQLLLIQNQMTESIYQPSALSINFEVQGHYANENCYPTTKVVVAVAAQAG